MLDIVPSCNLVQYKRKLKIQSSENLVMDTQTDGPTDGPTDEWTDEQE